jgi:hypothetical protein
VGAFLLMEAGGIGGPMLGVVLVPGLLAAGIGTLIFVGLDNWTGYGTFSLAVPNIPAFTSPTVAEFLWAFVIGLAAAVIGTAIRRGALALQPVVERRMLLLLPVAGLGIGLLAVAFGRLTDHPSSEVLFSGQDSLPGLIEGAAGWTAGALVLLVICKGLAYTLALSGFRGGPVFPGMFIGARDRALAPPRPADGRRRRHGDRRDDDGDARAAADRGAARLAVPQRRRPGALAARDRGGGRGLRRGRAAAAGAAAGRRRRQRGARDTGMTATILVPLPAGLSTLNEPPAASTRSRRPCRPVPPAVVAPPTPSSAISMRSVLGPAATRTRIDVAPECFWAFVTASAKT